MNVRGRADPMLSSAWRERSSTPVPGAVALLIVSFPFVAWWLIGDLSETDESHADYIVKAPEVSTALTAVIGAGCLVASLLAAFVIIHAVMTGRDDRRWITASLLGVLAGLVLAWGLRVVTAGTAGANIGGGIVLLFAPFVFLALAARAISTVREALIRR